MREPRVHRIVLALAALACLACAPFAAAQSLDGYAEFGIAQTRESSETPPNAPSTADTRAPYGRLQLNFAHMIWPNLTFVAGGFFEYTKTTGTLFGADVDANATRLRPLVSLRLNTQTVRADLGIDRNDTRSSSFGVTTRQIRDSVNLNGGWFPSSANFLQLQLVQADDHDGDRSQLDRISRAASLWSQYRPAEWATLQYRAGVERIHDRVDDYRASTDTQNGRVYLTKSFLERRVIMSTDYAATWVKARLEAGATGVVDVRLFPSAGLSLLSDLPDRSPLTLNVALIDSDRAASAGLNIGLQPPGGDIRLRNFGLDFGVPTSVNLFHVWVDRELREEVAQSFTWEVWTSDDNDRWTRVQTIAAAPFGPFENRFELEFTPVVTRFVKLVTRTLASTVPFASDYPVIQITELESFNRVRAGARENVTTRTSQQFAFNSRVQLIKGRALYYDLNYIASTATGAGRRTNMINSLSYSGRWGRVWSGAARADSEWSNEPNGRRTAKIFSGTLSARPNDAVTSTLLVSARREDLPTDQLDTDTASLSTYATVYPGIDAQFSLGGSRQENASGRRTSSTLASAGLQFVPNSVLSFGAHYQDNSRRQSGGGSADLDDPNTAFDVSVTVSPAPAMYLFASRRTENQRLFGKRTLHNYTASWSPFPYGSIRLYFYYNENFESQFESLSRQWGSSVRWLFQTRSYLEFTYQRLSTDSLVSHGDRKTATGTLRIGF